MNNNGFWQGVLLWVKLFLVLACGFFLILIMPPLDFDTSGNFKHTLGAITIMVVACAMLYLVYMGHCKRLRVKRRGFWVAALATIVTGTLMGALFYPLVGFACSLFCATVCYKLARGKLHPDDLIQEE